MSVFYFIGTVPLLLKIPIKKILSKSSYSQLSKLRIGGTVATAYSLAIVVTGVMFKLLLLPGAGEMLGIGTMTLFIISVISTFKYLKTKEEFYKSVLIRTACALSFGFLFYIIPSNIQVQFFYRDKPNLVELHEKLYNDPTNEDLSKQFQEELRKQK